MNIKPALLIFFQFALIGILVFSTGKISHGIIGSFLAAGGILLALLAIKAMQKSKLRISPVPDPDAVLIQEGPYRFIRHPMYSSILLSMAGFLLFDYSTVRLFLYLFLFAVLMVKLHWEEQLLMDKFSGYRLYCKSTKRLIPFIY